MSRWKGVDQRQAIAARKNHCPLSFEKIEEMFEEFKKNPSINHIARKFDVPKSTVIQAIDEGWPNLGYTSFSERIRKISRQLEEVSDYNEVMLRKRAIQDITRFEDRFYELLGGRSLDNISLDQDSFRNLTPRSMKDVAGVIQALTEAKIKLSSGLLTSSSKNSSSEDKSDKLTELLKRSEEEIIDLE